MQYSNAVFHLRDLKLRFAYEVLEREAVQLQKLAVWLTMRNHRWSLQQNWDGIQIFDQKS